MLGVPRLSHKIGVSPLWSLVTLFVPEVSFLKEVSQKSLVFEFRSFIFEGSLAEKLRFRVQNADRNICRFLKDIYIYTYIHTYIHTYRHTYIHCIPWLCGLQGASLNEEIHCRPLQCGTHGGGS